MYKDVERGFFVKIGKGLKIMIALIAILLCIDLFAGNYFYNLAIKREQKTFLQGNEDLEVSASAMNVFTKGGWRDWVASQSFEGWQLQTFDDLTLKGYYLPATTDTNKTVIFGHGYLGKATDMGLYAQYYYEELGYNIFLFDMRGHGKSEGDYFGFGWHDRLDVLDWIDQVIERVGTNAEIVLHGLSMGAGTMLMASGEELPPQVQAVIADSGYTNVYDLFQYQMNRMYNIPAFPVLPTTSMVSNIRANYSFYEASAIDQVKKAKVPILYFHGKEDTFVPSRMANELYEETNSHAEIFLYDDAGHGEAYALHKEKYQTRLADFLTRFIDK